MAFTQHHVNILLSVGGVGYYLEHTWGLKVPLLEQLQVKVNQNLVEVNVAEIIT